MKDSTILVWKVVGLFVSGYALLISIINMVIYEKIRKASCSLSQNGRFSPCSGKEEVITQQTARNLFVLNLTIALLSFGAFILLIYLIVKKPEQVKAQRPETSGNRYI